MRSTFIRIKKKYCFNQNQQMRDQKNHINRSPIVHHLLKTVVNYRLLWMEVYIQNSEINLKEVHERWNTKIGIIINFKKNCTVEFCMLY